MSYSYKAYDPYEDEKYKKAKNALDAHGTYQPSDNYTKAMDYASKIENREPFSYDINADALYQQYKDNYIQQGMLASIDTMGQAAAMTGGYGNSYAQSVGQQAYNQHLNQLNNIVPELYGMAYSRYQQEGKDLKDAFNMYMGLEDRNKEHWDKEYNRLSAEEQNLYKRGYDEWNQKNTQAWNEYLMGVEGANDARTNLQKLIVSSGYNPTDAELKAAGITREQANAWRESYNSSNTPKYTAFTYEEQAKWTKDFSKATTITDVEKVADRMEQAGIDPKIVATWADWYKEQFKSPGGNGSTGGISQHILSRNGGPSGQYIAKEW